MNNYQPKKSTISAKTAQMDDTRFYTMVTLGSIPVFLIAAITFHMLPAF